MSRTYGAMSSVRMRNSRSREHIVMPLVEEYGSDSPSGSRGLRLSRENGTVVLDCSWRNVVKDWGVIDVRADML